MKNTLRIMLLLVAVVASNAVVAQLMPTDPDAQQAQQSIEVPIDGGIFTVVGSAVAYGVYRLKNKNK